MPKKEKFPKQIFVTRELLANRETFLSANEDLDSIEDEQDVAVYVLDGVSRLKITKTFK